MGSTIQLSRIRHGRRTGFSGKGAVAMERGWKGLGKPESSGKLRANVNIYVCIYRGAEMDMHYKCTCPLNLA